MISTPRASKPFYFEWSIFTDPVDIDGPEGDEQPVSTIEGNSTKSDSSDSDDEEDKENGPNNSLPHMILPDLGSQHSRLKGYEYTEFNPTINWDYLPDICMAPMQSVVF